MISATGNIYPACSLGGTPPVTVFVQQLSMELIVHTNTHEFTRGVPFAICSLTETAFFLSVCWCCESFGGLILSKDSVGLLFHRIAYLFTLICIGLHPCYREAGVLTLEITCRWVFVCDQKFPTGLLSDQEVKTKQRQQT